MTSETSPPTRKRKRSHQDQQQQCEKCEEVDVVMDEMCRSGCEVFNAVYRDAQRYELRGLMAHLLTRLMVWILFVLPFLSVLKLEEEGHTVFHLTLNTHTHTHTHTTSTSTS